MKRIISLSLAIILCMMFAACGAYSSSAVQEVKPTSAVSHTPIPFPTSTPIPDDGYKSDGKLHVYIVGEGEKLLTPDSSFIKYIVYYPESRHMIINMSGKDYAYANVSSSFWSDFTKASSKDNFYNDKIRDKSEFLLNGYVSGRGDDIVVEYIDSSIKLIESQTDYSYSSTPSYSNYYRDFTYCESCGREMSRDDMYYIEAYDIYLCENCFDNSDYYSCECCGEVYYIDDMYCDDDGFCYCEWCWEDMAEGW